MTSSKSDKLTKIVLAAAGIGVSAFLIVKYHKQIFNKFEKAKNVILHEKLNIQRKNFDVTIINDVSECGKVIKTLEEHCKNFNILGFDCEWVTVSNERRKVALVQLCSGEGYCALFRLCKFSKIPLELRMLLENPEIIKVGVACNDDAKHLLADYAIKVNGCFDIRFLALLANHKAESLAKLSKSILNIHLDKNWRITCSDWEAEKLSPVQIDYAAKDAFVAVEIFRKLYSSIRPNANNPSSILQFCDKYTDISFKNKLAQMNLDPADGTVTERKLLSYSKRQKDINKILKRAYATRDTNLYDNCYLQAPDGVLLCTCDKRKAEWYVQKGLATIVSDDSTNLTVRLNFEPAGRAVGETGLYYQTEKENKCVVCGKEKDLLRKNVVPHEYRKFFPSVMKDKTSHDILLLCLHCHQLSNISDINVRKMLEVKCDAPIHEAPKNDDDIKKFKTIQRAAKALANFQVDIPEKRQSELKKTLHETYPGKELTVEFLKEILAQKEPEMVYEKTHSELVVEFYKNNDGLIALEKIFRQHFLDTMKPKFLPEYWDINHNENRLKIRASENRVDVEDLKVAGIEEEVIQKLEQPSIVVSNVESSNNSLKADEEFETASLSSFYSAAAGRFDQTDDERYYSDSATIASFYETIRDDDSTVDLTDFKSFENSTETLNNLDDDSDDSTIGSPDFPDSLDSLDDEEDTEVEEVGVAEKVK